jgi:NAD(P)-dependent dehydrogenase (short-subunit alcohol dehydrogenase family)
MRAAVLGKIPLGQFALTSDVAGAIIYLASDAGRMVTGTIPLSTEDGFRNDGDYASHG